ncbi:FK506-binding protein 59 [Teleopsis dalmanni]|uniref:FK506-binding protein 59 n=1 Tax=Teleopsis dalmanni TaxID=139649 RepID=UPI0018CF185A|nr:FK506-binding protein 59 [Teleopsis dalmanni]
MSEEEVIDLSGDGGVTKVILEVGTGSEQPSAGCKVQLHYTGSLTDGTVFDSSVGRGPFEFDLGKGHVIKAFDMGVSSMKLNEKCKLTCHPDYAYGAGGSPPSIPPNATLIFELELLKWEGEDVSPEQDHSIERFIIQNGKKRGTPQEGALVKVHLIGKYAGNVFEDREVEFCYGEATGCGVIEGIEHGISKMTLNETSRLVIQPKHAFGEEGHKEYNIPPNSVVEYIVKVLNIEKQTVADWTLTPEEKIEQANKWKDKGTMYYKQNQYKLAIKMYSKCLSYAKDDSPNEIKDAIKLAAHNNIALCCQKLHNEFEGKQACTDALTLDPNNIKALYRRGQCNLAVNEFLEAITDFKKVIELEPNNKAAHNQIIICNQRIKEANEREKKIYSGMFAKFAAVDKTSPIAEPDVLAKCGEWTDEDDKREVDLAFERDNNIVMI